MGKKIITVNSSRITTTKKYYVSYNLRFAILLSDSIMPAFLQQQKNVIHNLMVIHVLNFIIVFAHHLHYPLNR